MTPNLKPPRINTRASERAISTDADLERQAGSGRIASATPIAYPLATAIIVSGLSRSSIYRAIKAGDISAVKAGRSTLILADSLRGYLNGLPPALSASPRKAA